MACGVFSGAAAQAFVIDDERPLDANRREKLLDRAMGARWRRKTSEKLRAGRLPALALCAYDAFGRLIGTVRLWHAQAGATPVLLLGPLAVAESARARGVGAALMKAAIAEAGDQGHGAIVLMGDAAYYGRFGFSSDFTRALAMPGPYEAERFLGLELRRGALKDAYGELFATGARRPPREKTLKAA